MDIGSHFLSCMGMGDLTVVRRIVRFTVYGVLHSWRVRSKYKISGMNGHTLERFIIGFEGELKGVEVLGSANVDTGGDFERGKWGWTAFVGRKL